ncbi:hypothetical protein J1N35_042935 [Gossypium stocksii]|uniref:Uncharacterized protein n=1 Tax=Gossypium stocksii TaxID=47602 RepID=A0A9D3U6F1_9ROSI|nr:hypothetical protein J1N35_042935 [Gossypium stocksii]
MNPKHLCLVEKKCEDLQRQSLIEPSDSQRACEAFYVNKMSEQIRGKLKLVLLRWAEWFSKYLFDVKHIKTNVLADLLTWRTKEVMASRTFHPKPIMIYRPVASSSSKNSVQAFLIPPNLNPEFPLEVMRLVGEKTFHQKTRDMMFEYQLQVFRNFGGLVFKPFDEVTHSDNKYRTCRNIFASLIELSHLKSGLLHILMLYGTLCQMASIINNFFKHFKNIKMIF